MNHRIWSAVLIALIALLVVGAAVAMAQSPGAPAQLDQPAPLSASVATTPAYTYTTVITVTSGTDPDNNGSYTCESPPADGKCTLRRAIVQSRNVPAGERPVLIRFDIPQNAAEGYNSGLGVWEIWPKASTIDNSVYRRLKGQVIIDGSTQPSGRADGPKIILMGPGTGQEDGFIVGDIATDGEIVMRGLGMQNFKSHMIVNSVDNVIEDCWFGLSSDGTTLSSGDSTDAEGGTGVALMATAERNTIRNNRFAGFTGPAAAIRGDNNTFSGNLIGMRADGLVPIPAQFDIHPCTGNAWAGGMGITVEGDGHSIGGPNEIDGNRFAGLYLDAFAESEPPFAIEMIGAGQDVLIQSNLIGLDINNDVVGICGRGIKMSGGPEGTQVLDNTIVEPGWSAILMNHWTLNGNTLRGNIIKRESPWPPPQGDNEAPEDAIAYGKTVPDALRQFSPAEVTKIDGLSVQGTSGSGSPCPHCIVELFLDDTDTVVEALTSLAVVTANASGNWTASLSAPLETGQGLRTMSTVPDDWTITDLDEGSTSNLSTLYTSEIAVFLPFVIR